MHLRHSMVEAYDTICDCSYFLVGWLQTQGRIQVLGKGGAGRVSGRQGMGAGGRCAPSRAKRGSF